MVNYEKKYNDLIKELEKYADSWDDAADAMIECIDDPENEGERESTLVSISEARSFAKETRKFIKQFEEKYHD